MSTDVWLPVFTLVLGAALGFAAEMTRDQRAEKRREADRRRDFDLQVLAELRTALRDLARAVFAVSQHSTVVWSTRQLPWHRFDQPQRTALLNSVNDAASHTTLVAGEVGDAELGQSLNDLWERGFHPFMTAPTPDQELAAFNAFLNHLATVSARIAALQRSRLGDDPATRQ